MRASGAFVRAAVAVAAAAVVAGTAPSAASAEAAGDPAALADRVVVFLVDRVSFADIEAADAPTLDELFSHGSVGLVSPTGEDPGSVASYAAAGAGAVVPADVVATLGGLAFEPGEPLDGGTAADVWTALTGGPAPAEGIVVPYLLAMRDEAARRRPSSLPGALGDALHRAGLRTAVVGSADAPGAPAVPLGAGPAEEPLPPGIVRTDLKRHRGAALIVADGRGVVDAGSVVPSLLRVDRGAPGARRSDPVAFVAAAVEALGSAEVVVLDPGDLARVDLDAGSAADRRAAIEAADAMLAEVLAALPDPDRTMVVVGGLAPSARMLATGRELTPLVVRLPGRFDGGLLRSDTTRVPGLVTATDLGPTILGSLGVEVPVAMAGASALSASADGDGSEAAFLREESAAARDRSTAAPGWAVGFAVAAVAGVLAALTSTRRLAPAVASVPVWGVLLRTGSPWVAGVGAVALAGVVWWLAGRDRDRPVLVVELWMAAGLVLLADLALGGDLQRVSPFGPDLASRPAVWLGDAAIGVTAAGWMLASRSISAGRLRLVPAGGRDGAARVDRAAGAAGTAVAVVLTVGAASLAGLVGGGLAGAAVVATAGFAGARSAGERRIRVGSLAWIGLAGVLLAVGVAAVAASQGGPAGEIWRRGQDLGWGEVLGVAGARAAGAVRAAVSGPWLLVVAAAGYAVRDAWPRTPLPVRAVAAATAAPAAVALLATDAGAAAAGWLAVFACTLVASAQPRPDLEPGPGRPQARC